MLPPKGRNWNWAWPRDLGLEVAKDQGERVTPATGSLCVGLVSLRGHPGCGQLYRALGRGQGSLWLKSACLQLVWWSFWLKSNSLGVGVSWMNLG